jgi:hypothetical protein
LGLCTSTMVHSTGKVSEDNVFPMASEVWTRQCVDGYPVSGTVGCWWTGGLSHPLNASPGHLTRSQQKEPFHDNYRPCGHAFSFQKQGCPSNPICNFCNFGAYTLAQRAQAQVWNNGPPVTRFEPALRSMDSHVPWSKAGLASCSHLGLIPWLPSGKHTKSYWTWPIEIVSFPINSMVDLSHSYVAVYQAGS